MALVGILLAAPASAQFPEDPPALPTSEGALDNDVFLAVDEGAQASIAKGDVALARARAQPANAPPAEWERLYGVAFDAWQEALARSAPGAWLWFRADPTAERRLAEGVRAAVERRVRDLSEAERSFWTTRTSRAADAELRRCRGRSGTELEDSLARCLRRYPASAPAAQAALQLGDLALEAGRTQAASAWYGRGLEEARGAGANPLEKALEERRARLPSATNGSDEPWTQAYTLHPVGALAWEERARRPASAGNARHLPRPGGAFLSAERFVVQTATELLLFGLAKPSPTQELGLGERVPFQDLLGAETPELRFEVPREPPGWPLLPWADADGLVLVLGRSQADEPNALVALEVEAERAHQNLGLELTRAAAATVRIAWTVRGAERRTLAGSVPIPELLELGDFEFQPGPVVSADSVLVQARQIEGQVRAHLLAFERASGRLLWRRLLASGADRVATPRFSQVVRRVAGQPLLALESSQGPAVFVGTHLGLGVLADALLGEGTWAFKNRRRGEREAGWSGDRPVLVVPPEDPGLVLWAPMDSDRAYVLRTGALLAGPSEADAVLAVPCFPRIEAQSLVGGSREELVVLGTTGRERTLSERPVGKDRLDALDLRQDERFRGRGLLSARRALVATNESLYLFDRERELYLLAYEPLAERGADELGGDLYARGRTLVVVGDSAAWVFQAE